MTVAELWCEHLVAWEQSSPVTSAAPSRKRLRIDRATAMGFVLLMFLYLQWRFRRLRVLPAASGRSADEVRILVNLTGCEGFGPKMDAGIGIDILGQILHSIV